MNAEKCRVSFAGIEAFARGLQLYSLGATYYTGYNAIFLGFLYNNNLQITMEPGDATSWVNQNSFYHGACHHDSNFGTGIPFCRSVLIRQFGNDTGITTTATSTTVTAGTFTITQAATNFTALGLYIGAWVKLGGSALNTKTYQVTAVGTTTMTLAGNSHLTNETTTMTITTRGGTFGNIPNNNNFYGTCFESVVADYLMEIQGGSQNNFYGCRWEATTLKLAMCGMGAGAPTQYNSIFGGYTNSSSDYAVLVNAFTTSNRYETSARMVMSGLDAYGPLQLANVGGITQPAMTIWGVNNTGEDTWAKPTGSGWMCQIGAYYWDQKAAASAVAQIRISSDNGGNIYFGTGAAMTTANPNFTVSGANAGISCANGYLNIATVGKGLQIKQGTNAKQGRATLAAGSVVVANTSVTANSDIIITGQVDGGTPGWCRVSARTPGTSFTITSSSGSDTSVVGWLMLEPGV